MLKIKKIILKLIINFKLIKLIYNKIFFRKLYYNFIAIN